MTARPESDAERARLEALGRIVEGSPAVFFLWRIALGRWPVEAVAAGVERLLGYAPEDFMSGRVSWPGITHPEDVPRLEREVAEFLAQRREEWSQEYRLIAKDGRTVWAQDWNRVVCDANGKPTHIQAFVLDITERKRAEEELRESARRLQEQQVALEQKNAALRELVEQVSLEKVRIHDDIVSNLEEVVLPLLNKLRLKGASRKYVALLAHHLRGVTSSYARHIVANRSHRLTPRETEICNMVKAGLSSKEIAKMLGVSSQTVQRHRKNVRRKLGISRKKLNLSVFLAGA